MKLDTPLEDGITLAYDTLENNIFSGSDTEENTIRKIIEQRSSSEPNKPKIIGLYRNYDDVGRFNAIQTNDYFGIIYKDENNLYRLSILKNVIRPSKIISLFVSYNGNT